MKKATTSFASLSDGNLESKTHEIITAMTGNLNFPNPIPALADITAAATAYTTALSKAGTGNRIEVPDKNAKRETLIGQLRILCNHINTVANGDAAMILSSGFNLSKDRQPSVLTRPENIRVENGVASGSLLVSVKAVKGAYAYFHEYTTDVTMAPGSWVSTSGTTSKMQFTNLQPGTTYYCRVGAIGTNNQVLYSDPVSRMVI